MSAKSYMEEKQRQRAELMELVLQKKLKLIDASSRLKVLVRQSEYIVAIVKVGMQP